MPTSHAFPAQGVDVTYVARVSNEEAARVGVEAGQEAEKGNGTAAAAAAATGERRARPSMTGWLRKRGGGTSTLGRRTWRSRFFVLEGAYLYYYKTQAEFANHKDAVRAKPVDLPGHSVAIVTDSEEYEFEIVPLPGSGLVRTWCLRAASEEERQAWVQALKAAAMLDAPES